MPGPAAPHVLIVYASTHGHTGRIAEHLGTTLEQEGLAVRVAAVGAVSEQDVADADGVIAAASVHLGHHQRKMVRWLERHAEALAGRPTALVSVSLTAADDTDEARATTQALIDDVLADAHWTPTSTVAVAGALQYQAYNLPTRLLMKLISRSHGGPTDTSQDAELTDWAGVERFARAFAAELRQPGSSTALRGTTTTGHGD